MSSSSRRRFAEYRRLRRKPSSGDSRKPGDLASAGSHGNSNADRSLNRAAHNGHAPAGEAGLPGGPAARGGEKARRPQHRSFGSLLLAFLRLLKGHRGAIGFGLLAAAVATVLGLAPPAATKLAIDSVLNDEPLPGLWSRFLPLPPDRITLLYWLGGGVATISLLRTAIHLAGRWHSTRTVNRLQVDIRRRVFSHAVRLPLHRVYELKSGGAASLIREDAGGISELVFSMLFNPFRAAVQLVGSLIVLVWVDWRLMLGGLLLVPAVYLTHRTWINRIRPMYRDIRSLRQEIDGQTTEAFGGMRIVRTFGRERSETGRFVRNNNLMVRQQLFVWWWARLVELAWEVLIPLASTAVLLYGGYQVLHGNLTLGDLTMFLFYLALLLEPLATLAASATALQNNLAGLERVLDLLDEPSEMPRTPDSIRLRSDQPAGRLEFRDVGFRYPGAEQPVLQHVHLDILPGQTVALVGRSGAGKTTLCNLAARFYDPTEGSIAFDGRDLRDIDVDSYRSLLGIVEQDVFLFDGTIRENIGYAARRATPQQIEDAARAAHAHEFIVGFPDGYDTFIGERGVKLSGGQRQRLAIARALLADPRILILDEATSNLDTESERLIQQGLDLLLQGRTCFVIAHRLSTIRHADRIVVLEAGRVLETGTHDELMAASGRYRQMVDLQLGPEADRTRPARTT